MKNETNKINEDEAIEIRLALEDRINNINKRIAECQSVNLTGNVDYWQDKLQKAQSAQNKLRYSVLFMVGE